MSANRSGDPTLKYEHFAAAISEALRATAALRCGAAWESRVVISPEQIVQPSPASHASLVTLRLGGDLCGDLLLSINEDFISRLCAKGGEADPSPNRALWLEFLEASRPSLAAALGAVFGSVSIEHCEPSGAIEDATTFAEITFQSTSLQAGELLLLTGPKLRTSLQRAAIQVEIPTGMLPVGEGGHLNRVIDVPLAVTLRFGQRHLTLRELLALSTGSLLELDRQVEEPVDLMLGERIVARGEVVIVDGNYGMRVTQIVENTPGRSAPAVG